MALLYLVGWSEDTFLLFSNRWHRSASFLVSLALLWLMGSRLEGGRHPIFPGGGECYLCDQVTFVSENHVHGGGGGDMVSNGVLSLWNPSAVLCNQMPLAVQLLWVGAGWTGRGLLVGLCSPLSYSNGQNSASLPLSPHPSRWDELQLVPAARGTCICLSSSQAWR